MSQGIGKPEDGEGGGPAVCPWGSQNTHSVFHLSLSSNMDVVPSPGDLPDPGIEPQSPVLQADALPSEPPGKLGCGSWHPKTITIIASKIIDHRSS